MLVSLANSFEYSGVKMVERTSVRVQGFDRLTQTASRSLFVSESEAPRSLELEFDEVRSKS